MTADLTPLMREMAQKAGAPLNPYADLYALRLEHVRAAVTKHNLAYVTYVTPEAWASIENDLVRLAVLANGWPVTEPVTP